MDRGETLGTVIHMSPGPSVPYGDSPQGSPEQFPVPPPPGFQAADHSWVLQTIMELQKSNGEMTHALRTLSEQVKEQTATLGEVRDQVSKGRTIMITAAVIAGALLTALTYLIDKGLEYFSQVNLPQ